MGGSQFLCKVFRKQPFQFYKYIQKSILSKETPLGTTMRKCALCFLLNCRFQFLSHGILEELLQKLYLLCFTYQHVDCFYTLSKYQFSGKIVVKIGQVFVDVQRAVYFNQKYRGVGRMHSIARKRILRKMYRKH